MTDVAKMFTLYQLYHLGFNTAIKNDKRFKITLSRHHVNRAYISLPNFIVEVSLRKGMLLEIVGKRVSQYSWRLIKGEV